MTPGILYLLPNSLGGPVSEILPPQVAEAVRQLDGLIAESDRGGRRFLEQFQGLKKSPHQIPIALLNEHSKGRGVAQIEHLDWLLEPVLKGQTWGYVSDAGLPCLADPGSALVTRARQKGVTVKVLSGPSAPLLALLASGLPAQEFQFHGYAPKEPEARAEWIRKVSHQGMTQICIEAPYRNAAMLDGLIDHLPEESLLAVVCDATLPTEEVIVTTVSQWRLRREQQRLPSDLTSRPAVFLFVPRGTLAHTPKPQFAAAKQERSPERAPSGPRDRRQSPRSQPRPASERGRPRRYGP
jgi:16S rRNA (cytidine1402-2'-O)-methyltransferase